MALLSLLIVAGLAYSAVVAVLTSRTYFGVSSNKPFAPAWPDIDPPLWRVALGHIAGLLSTILWLLRWPSVTEVWMALCLVPLLFVPFPLVLNNMLEWGTYLLFGNARGDGSHRDFWSGAPPLRWASGTLFSDLAHAALSAYHSVTSWIRLMWRGRTWNANTVNYNHSLLCYLQSESWAEMHHLDPDVLSDFPTAGPNSRANAVMMARCATMSYDRWHNIDQAVHLRWNEALKQQPTSSTKQQKFSLVKAWSFDRVTVPSSLELQDPPQSTSSDTRAADAPVVVAKSRNTVPSVPPSMNFISFFWTTILEVMVLVQEAVTAVKVYLKDTTLKALRWLVWFWADAGVPDDNKPVFDADKFTSINTDAFLMRADGQDPETGGRVVALVLAFRGTEALQTVDWISDLAQVAPPPEALDLDFFPLGFTHQGFRDSLGIKRDLRPADDLKDLGFTSSYLVYKPNRGTVDGASGTTGSGAPLQGQGWAMGALQRVTPGKDEPQESPFTVITRDIGDAINSIKAEGANITVKVFVTGHSLGGALAHLYTGALLLCPPPNSPTAESFEGMYTFGEPRVGSQTWVTLVEEALRGVKGPGGVAAEDRFKRMVNTLDVVTRIPPPLGELYQHSGHCTFVKPHFAIARPAATQGTRSPAAAALAVAAALPPPSPPPPPPAPSSDASSSKLADTRKAEGTGQVTDKSPAGDQTAQKGVPAVHSQLPTGPAAATAAAAASVRASDSSYSPVANLIETPEIFLGPTLLTVLLKLVLSLMLLLSAVVLRVVHEYGWGPSAATLLALGLVFWPVSAAALAGMTAALTITAATAVVAASVSIFTFVFWPSLYDAIIGPVLKELQVSFLMLSNSLKQPIEDRPRLLNNPMYLLTRLVALLGPAPIVLLLDMLLLPAVVLFAPVVGWTVFVEPVLVGLLFLLMPPAIIGGLVDHSMAEYYTACWLTTDADWTTVTA